MVRAMAVLLKHKIMICEKIKLFVKHAAAGAFFLHCFVKLIVFCVFSRFWADLAVVCRICKFFCGFYICVLLVCIWGYFRSFLPDLRFSPMGFISFPMDFCVFRWIDVFSAGFSASDRKLRKLAL